MQHNSIIKTSRSFSSNQRREDRNQVLEMALFPAKHKNIAFNLQRDVNVSAMILKTDRQYISHSSTFSAKRENHHKTGRYKT